MITHAVCLSVSEKRKDLVVAVQGESQSRSIRATVYERAGKILSLQQAVVSLYVKKPSGFLVMIPGEVETSGENVLFTLTKGTCSEAGYCRCFLQIVYGDQRDLRVDGLELFVLPCDLEDAVESTAEFSALEKALAQVAQFSSHVKTIGNPHGTTAEQVGARPDTWLPSATEIGAVPASRTINGKTLSGNIVITASDVGAMGSETVVPVSQGGTGQSTPAAARNALGLGDMAEVHFGDIYQNNHKVVDYDTLPMNNLLQARTNLGLMKKLWSGNWTTGNITAEEFQDYTLFFLHPYGGAHSIIAMKVGDTLRGIGGQAGDGNQTVLVLQATCSENTLSELKCFWMNHAVSGDHGAKTDVGIADIYGVC